MFNKDDFSNSDRKNITMSQCTLNCQDNHSVASDFSSEKNESEGESEQSSDNDLAMEQNLGVALPNSNSDFGDIIVRHSKKVRFGNQTIIQGPVTVNHLVQGSPGPRNSSEIQSSPKNVLDNDTENHIKNNTSWSADSLSHEVNIKSKHKFDVHIIC